MRELPWCVIDTETTGLRTEDGARMIEIAMVRLENGEVTDVFTTLLDAGVTVTDEITEINRITQDDLAGAPTFADVADAVEARLAGCVVVAHNVSFDWKFVRSEFAHVGRDTPPAKLVCTVEGARQHLPELGRHRLGMVCDHFGITLDGWHAALADTMACAQVCDRLLDLAEAKGRGTLARHPWFDRFVPTAELPQVAHKARVEA